MTMEHVDGGQLLAHSLKDAGVDTLFALHGGHLDSFWVACHRLGIKLVDGRHEGSIGHSADGYARASGGLGVAVVTSGPGFANGFAALPNALVDAVPLLMISSSPPLGEALTNEMQGGVDQVAAARAVTKWAQRVTHAERVPDMVAMAIRAATSGRPGPVYLEVPIDVMFTPVPLEAVHVAGSAVVVDRPAPSPARITEALDLLQAAERPAIIIGGGTLWSDCGQALGEFAEATRTPVFANNRAVGVLDAKNPMNGFYIDTLRVLQGTGQALPDVVLMLGARAGLFTGGRSGSFLAGSRIIQVDVDASEFGRLGPIDVGLVGDCGETLHALNRALAASDRDWPDRAEWIATATGTYPFLDSMMSADYSTADGRVHPYQASRDSLVATGPDAVVVMDGGEAPLWPAFGLAVAPPHRVLNLGYMGFLGIGMGFAIGAQLAEPDRRVLHITGDGALGFHIQEFDTMVRHGLPIVTVVLNNACWGMSIHGQEAVYGVGNDVITKLNDTRYDLVAAGFGCYGEHVTDPAEVGPAVERAFASGLPACINVATSATVVHPATTMMLGDFQSTDEIVIPYYDNIRK